MSSKWDRRFLNLAREVASWSKDPSTKVGAVIVDHDRHILATGFNGFPRMVEDSDERLFDRDLKLKLSVHAELNAILQAGKLPFFCSIYVSAPFLCNECVKAVIQSGLIRIVKPVPNPEDRELLERWKDSIKISQIMLKESNVQVIEVEF